MRSVSILCLTISLIGLPIAAKSAQYVNSWHEFQGAQSYKDAATNLIFYVESDGRHVTAIDSKGKVLWTRDPFLDAHLEHYRTEKPQIVYIGAPLEWMVAEQKGHYVAINFNSTQFGIINVTSGEFIFLGQD